MIKVKQNILEIQKYEQTKLQKMEKDIQIKDRK